MTEKLKLYVAISQLLFVTIFIGLAVWQFVEGNQANGILWLILCQIYSDSAGKAAKEG